MRKLFRKKEMVSFKNEEQKNKILEIATEFNVNWYGNRPPVSYDMPETAIGICFNEGECLGFLSKKGKYKEISVKKLLKRVEKYREGKSRDIKVRGWYKGDTEDNKFLMYLDPEEDLLFGFKHDEEWFVGKGTITEICVVKATDDEVLPRLKKEAEKKGFVAGVRVGNTNIGYGYSNRLIENDTEYYLNNSKNDFIIDGCTLMHNGEWAEIFDETGTAFKPVFMKCTKEQFDKMKPKLESVGADLHNMNYFSGICCWLINNFNKSPLNIDVFATGYSSDKRTEVYTEAEFLASCGYTEEPYVPKVGDFGLFWNDDIQEENRIGYIKEINTKNFYPYRCISGEAFDNFTLLPKETESIFMDIKNREVEK